MNTLKLLNNERNSYGIRTNDFRRYRIHCTSKIKTLKRQLNLKNGSKKKYKSITDEDLSKVKDIRALEFLLFQSERYWSCSNEEDVKKSVKVSKLRRSLEFSNALIQLSKNFNLTNNDIIQLEIYLCFIKGSFELLKNNYGTSLKSFTTSYKYIENSIQNVKDDKVLALFESWLDVLGPQIRLCASELGDPKSYEIGRIVDEQTKNESLLQVDKCNTDNNDNAIGDVKELMKWKNDNIRIASVNLVESLFKLKKSIDNYKTSSNKIEKLDELISVYSLTIEHASNNNDDGFSRDVLIYRMLTLTIQRDLDISANLKDDEPANNRSKVKMISSLIHNFEQLKALKLVENDDLDLFSLVDIKLNYYLAVRNYTLAKAHQMVKNYGAVSRLLDSSKLYIRSGVDLVNSLDQVTLNHVENFNPLIRLDDFTNLLNEIDSLMVNVKKELFASKFKRPLFFDIASTYVEPSFEYLLTKADKKVPNEQNQSHNDNQKQHPQEQQQSQPQETSHEQSSSWFESFWKRN